MEGELTALSSPSTSFSLLVGPAYFRKAGSNLTRGHQTVTEVALGCVPAYQMALRASYPDQGSALGREDLLEEGKATQSSILSWRIPQTEEAGGLQSRGSQRYD